MNKRQRDKIIRCAHKLYLKRNALLAEAQSIGANCQGLLNDLAIKACPFKKGQILRKPGQRVWAKIVAIRAHEIQHSIAFSEANRAAPYQLECLRCNVKGDVHRGNWIFVYGSEIGSLWSLVEE
jgi:hypothetical protein